MVILGLNAYHGDASAALVIDGRLVAAAEEERFTRIKHNAGFPYNAVRYCLNEAGMKASDLDHIAVSRNPKAHFHQKIFHALKRKKWNQILDRLLNTKKIWNIAAEVGKALDSDPLLIRAKVHWVEHHRAHLASSFFVSPFEKSALLSVDGFGDFVSTMWGIGQNNEMAIKGLVSFPHSLGVFYTAITQYLGFQHYGDEFKVMGLAAYGEAEYQDQFAKIIHKNGGISFKLSLPYFNHTTEGVSMTWENGSPALGNLFSENLAKLLGPHRQPDAPLEKSHQNIARSLQHQLETIMFSLLNNLYEKTKCDTLCMAGGVALNCVVNGQIFNHTPFKKVYIQPAANDAGTSIGAAFYVVHEILKHPRSFIMKHAYVGPHFSNTAIKHVLDGERISYREIPEAKLPQTVAEEISRGKIVGLFQGRMEFGPRALGNRSIVVDPRRAEMKDILNKRIKHREPFRPFAPSVLEEYTDQYFQNSHPSPFMLFTYKVTPEKQSEIPAPTHVDGTGRVQTVSRETNPFYWETIKAFQKLTGVPVLLNTSFNENEPIVCTPKEALDCFQRSRMDTLVMGNMVIGSEPNGKKA